ncbi:MAG: nucleotidyltransferase domain-containing protein [Opitutales bacterium]|nr:nucleotidyltransferase domain-containing protein [Opitutales bacterium]
MNWIEPSLFSASLNKVTTKDLRTKIAPLCKDQGVKRLDLFGSKARSPIGEGRDYDFLATFEDLPPEEYSQRFFRLLHGLEDSLNAPVDLLTPQSIRKESFRKKIEDEKICVYES